MFKRYADKLIVFLVLVASIIAMINFNERLEYARVNQTNDVSLFNTYFMASVTTFWIALAYIPGSWIYNKWRSYKQLQNENTSSELALLKSKIDPHFFFNTLNNLYGLALEKSDLVPAIILQLSDIMRYTIYEGEKETVTISEEAVYLEKYIEIHKIRYKSATISFSKDLEDEHQPVAPLLLVNLVENAFKHGLEQVPNGAFLQIMLQVKGNELNFTCINSHDHKNTATEDGIGLKNLKRRLELIYPNNHQLNISSDEDTFKAELQILLT